MKFSAISIVFAGLYAGLSPLVSGADDNEAAVESRRAALELAGAFSNDGYKIRDGFWSSTLDATGPAVLEVNLFEGNEYWFCVAALPPTNKIAVEVYAGDGSLMDQQIFSDDARVAVGIEPPISGRYFVKVSLVGGEPGDFTLVYCYK